MKLVQRLALAGIGLLVGSTGCEKQPAAPTALPLATGRLVRLETTLDNQGLRPRPRWEVDVAPLSFPGLTMGGVPSADYQQVKVFDLPDTAVYRVGRSIRFRYRLVPRAQQTP